MATQPVAIGDDPTRLNALVDALSVYLDKTLRITNPALDRDDLHWKRDAGLARLESARAETLATVLHEEAHYMPDTAQLDFLDALEQTAEKADRADRLATELMNICSDVDDEWGGATAEMGVVPLAPYASWWAYYHFTEIETGENSGIFVGGLGGMLRERIQTLAVEWLWECDRVLCHADDTQADNDAEVGTLIEALAKDIAKRVTLHNTAFNEVDKLTSDFLESQNEAEFTRTRVEAKCQARNDLRALKALKVVVSEPMSDAARTAFNTELPLLRMVVERPPRELGLVGENARRMNLPMLASCLGPGVEALYRMKIAKAWAGRHGAWALTAIDEAVRRIEGFSPKESSHFIKVARVYARAAPNGTRDMMPEMPWARHAQRWQALSQPNGPSTRTGLDEGGNRLVRLASYVWQLVGHGDKPVFEQGVISTDVVSGVAFEVMQLARLGRELIDLERMRSNVGVRLLSFNESIVDRASPVSGQLDRAQCELSMFSLRDITDALHPKLPLLERIYPQLALRTRERLGNPRTSIVPPEYETFVGDALALLLPAIEARRLALQLLPTNSPHPLGDMLRTVPRLRTWSPLEGKCKLELDDLREAHPRLRETLEHYVRQGSGFVAAKHVAAPEWKPQFWGEICPHRQFTIERARKAKVQFEFESMPLLQLLKM